MRKFVYILAIPLVGLTIACGSSTSSTSSKDTSSKAGDKKTEAPQVQTVAAGQPLILTEKILGSTTKVTVTLSNPRVKKPANEYDTPNKGQYFAVDVAVVVSEGKFSISSGEFKMVAADGTAYDSTITSDVQMLSANDLTPGQKTSGTVVFDTAAAAEKGGKIALKSMLASGDAGYWTL